MKNDIPILEFDTDSKAVIMPDHEHLGLELPERAVFAFAGDAVDLYAKEHDADVAGYFDSITKRYPVYVLDVAGQEMCLMQAPAGAPAAVQILDWLISYGVRKIISCGSCGVLIDIDEDEFLIPSRALRDEGTSYHYLPPARFIEVSAAARRAIETALRDQNLHYREVTTWSTDGIYRETKEKVEYRKSEGCSVVEMECAALTACAEMRGAEWGEILFTADTLADVSHYSERSWGKESVGYALELSIDALMNL